MVPDFVLMYLQISGCAAAGTCKITLYEAVCILTRLIIISTHVRTGVSYYKDHLQQDLFVVRFLDWMD